MELKYKGVRFEKGRVVRDKRYNPKNIFLQYVLSEEEKKLLDGFSYKKSSDDMGKS